MTLHSSPSRDTGFKLPKDGSRAYANPANAWHLHCTGPMVAVLTDDIPQDELYNYWYDGIKKGEIEGEFEDFHKAFMDGKDCLDAIALEYLHYRLGSVDKFALTLLEKSEEVIRFSKSLGDELDFDQAFDLAISLDFDAYTGMRFEKSIIDVAKNGIGGLVKDYFDYTSGNHGDSVYNENIIREVPLRDKKGKKMKDVDGKILTEKITEKTPNSAGTTHAQLLSNILSGEHKGAVPDDAHGFVKRIGTLKNMFETGKSVIPIVKQGWDTLKTFLGNRRDQKQNAKDARTEQAGQDRAASGTASRVGDNLSVMDHIKNFGKVLRGVPKAHPTGKPSETDSTADKDVMNFYQKEMPTTPTKKPVPVDPIAGIKAKMTDKPIPKPKSVPVLRDESKPVTNPRTGGVITPLGIPVRKSFDDNGDMVENILMNLIKTKKTSRYGVRKLDL